MQILPFTSFLQDCYTHQHDSMYVVGQFMLRYGRLNKAAVAILSFLYVKEINWEKITLINSASQINCEKITLINLQQLISMTGMTKKSFYSARSLLHSFNIIPSTYSIFQEQPKGRPAKKTIENDTAESSTPENNTLDSQVKQTA